MEPDITVFVIYCDLNRIQPRHDHHCDVISMAVQASLLLHRFDIATRYEDGSSLTNNAQLLRFSIALLRQPQAAALSCYAEAPSRDKAG